MQTYSSGKKLALTRKLNATDASLYADTDVGVSAGRLFAINDNQKEWISFTSVTPSGSEFIYGGLTRGLSQTAVPITSGTGLTWLATQEFILTAMHDQLPDLSQDNIFIGSNTFGNISFNKVTKPGLQPQSLTTTQRTALSLISGDTALVYDTTIGAYYVWSAGSWGTLGISTPTPNASETVAGKIEIATNVEMGTGTSTGGSGARLVIPNDQLVKTSSGAINENKLAVLNPSGKFADGFQNITLAQATTLTTGVDANSLHRHYNLIEGFTMTNMNSNDANGTIVGYVYGYRVYAGSAGGNMVNRYAYISESDGAEFTFTQSVGTIITFEFFGSISGGGISQYGLINSIDGGTIGNAVGILFTGSSSAVQARTSNGSSSTSTTLSGITVGRDLPYRFKFVWTVGTDVKFYVNGVLKATHTTNIPSSGFLNLLFGGGVSSDFAIRWASLIKY